MKMSIGMVVRVSLLSGKPAEQCKMIRTLGMLCGRNFVNQFITEIEYEPRPPDG